MFQKTNSKRLIKRLHPDAKLPLKKHKFDAGSDVFLIEDVTLKPYSSTMVPLGIAVQIKPGEMLTIRSRSSTKIKGISCTQTTCDAGYTGELKTFLINHTDKAVEFKKGERVFQLVFIKISENSEFVEAVELPSSSRNDSGFGSTGKF